MKKPLLSVLVLSYNNGDYIYETLSSILQQDYPNIEILIGDDASASFEQEKIEMYCKEQQSDNIVSTSTLVHPTNLKTCANLERLLTVAKGDYITIIAGDDTYYDQTSLSALMRAFEEDPELDISMGQTLMYDGADLTGENHPFCSQADMDLVNSGDTRAIFAALAGNLFLPAMGVVFRRDVFSRIGSIADQYQYVEDWSIQLRCTRMGMKMRFLDRVVAKHRGGGISHSKKPTQLSLDLHLDMMTIMENEVFPFMERFSKEEKAKIRHRYSEILRVYQEIRQDVLAAKELPQQDTIQNTKKLPPSNPLYTLILLHYYQEPFYQEALDSIFSQTYSNIELIFADDATPRLDKSALCEYIERKKTSNIRSVVYLFNEENQGTVQTLQNAVAKAHGKYVQFFAADDTLASSSAVSQIVDAFEVLPKDHKVLATRTAMMDFALKKTLWMRPTPEQEEQLSRIDQPSDLFRMTCTNCVFGISSMVFRTSLFSEYAYLDATKNRLIEDWPLILRLCHRGEPIHYEGFTTLHHRDGGISNRLSRGFSPLQLEFEKENLRIIEHEIMSHIDELPAEDQSRACSYYTEVVERYQARYAEEFGKWESDFAREFFPEEKPSPKEKPSPADSLKNKIIAKQAELKAFFKKIIKMSTWLGIIGLLYTFFYEESRAADILLLVVLFSFLGAAVLYVFVYLLTFFAKRKKAGP